MNINLILPKERSKTQIMQLKIAFGFEEDQLRSAESLNEPREAASKYDTDYQWINDEEEQGLSMHDGEDKRADRIVAKSVARFKKQVNRLRKAAVQLLNDFCIDTEDDENIEIELEMVEK